MALLHAASLTPSKLEAIAGWLPAQSWSPGEVAAAEVELVAAYRFDDPTGEVGLETHLVRAGGVLLQVPLTYRDAPLDGAQDALVCTMEHSALGPRWIYDGCADPVFAAMLATATTTGLGQAAQLIELDGRMVTRPAAVRLGGGGWVEEAVVVDGFAAPETDGDWSVLRSDVLELRLARRPGSVPAPAGVSHLSGSGAGLGAPVVLATARLL